MTAPWWEGPFLSFDVETTGVDVENDRIVTAACITVGRTGATNRCTWLVDPEIPIPEGATAIHGVTTEMARANGLDASESVAEIADALAKAWGSGGAVVGMNLAYDLTIIQRELVRYGHTPLTIGPVLDALVIDRAVDKYRKGSRKLVDLAAHYDVKLEGAHSSDGDALAAARVVWRQARHPKYGRVLQSMTLAEMQVWQADHHRAWAEHFQEYLRTKAKPPQPDAVIDASWPWRPLPVKEGAAA